MLVILYNISTIMSFHCTEIRHYCCDAHDAPRFPSCHAARDNAEFCKPAHSDLETCRGGGANARPGSRRRRCQAPTTLDNRVSTAGVAAAPRNHGNPEVFDLAAGLERRDQPARFLSPPRPGFFRCRRILIFGKDLRIFSALARPIAALGNQIVRSSFPKPLAAIELQQTPLQFVLFSHD